MAGATAVAAPAALDDWTPLQAIVPIVAAAAVVTAVLAWVG